MFHGLSLFLLYTLVATRVRCYSSRGNLGKCWRSSYSRDCCPAVHSSKYYCNVFLSTNIVLHLNILCLGLMNYCSLSNFIIFMCVLFFLHTNTERYVLFNMYNMYSCSNKLSVVYRLYHFVSLLTLSFKTRRLFLISARHIISKFCFKACRLFVFTALRTLLVFSIDYLFLAFYS